ncbi:conserved hypothetical protein [Methanocella paludicola SANAE]|uniref:Uncharacterized protein n=1 Tax=Methanocella paludicola (strain DSM 17711 / JCM 13418 / NBRC 101707 / SANAE) TaxID=304371 RepID=D1Z1I8_METPS|nr:hypothetical protein [Methanocella paludicola]BAI62560.1 conserved hypothetical protein [Methanocella paludicola SANAE]
MRDISTILQNAILLVAGNEGIARFNRAGHGNAAREILRSDGSLDLPRLMNIMLDVFPEEQASAIADSVLAKYVETEDEENKKAPAIETHTKKAEPESGLSYKDNLAKYLETEASDVQDLINEARRIRIAMGKSAPPKATVAQAAVAQAEPGPKISIVNPVLPAQETFEALKVPIRPAPAAKELGQEALESEISAFAEARKAYSSVDIMDFIRYLRDKGYHFQESSVLESVYTRIEERKSRERAALMADIQGFLGRMPWPTESEVSAYIEQKKSEGIVYESAEIKRMILVEMIKKH